MRLTGIKCAICASLVALTAAASSASAAWPRYYYFSWGGYWPYNVWSSYYGNSPWYASSYYPYYSGFANYYPSYSSYNPYYYSYSPSYYTPAYTAPAAVVAAPSSLTNQSFYPPSNAVATPPSNQATVVVRTAPDATLWFNGIETTQTGVVRTFGTPELRPGQAYSYDVRIRWMEDGRVLERTRKVAVTPGEKVEVDLTPASLLKNG
jgi:uncharacterized protein (TIGR03000 family)